MVYGGTKIRWNNGMMVYGGTKIRWNDGMMVYGGKRYDGINNKN